MTMTVISSKDDDDDEYISKEEFLEESYKILDNFFAKNESDIHSINE